MVLGWKKAFCTSIPKNRERETSAVTENRSPKPSNSRFGFFSNPSTPRLKSPPESSSNLRCKTPVDTTPTSSIPNSPKLQCKTSTPLKSNSPRFFQFSIPTTPKSPSSFSQLFRSSKIRCGICIENVKSGQGTAIFAGECSYSFHFPCIAAHVKKHQILICPVCGSGWKELAFPSIDNHQTPPRNIAVDRKTKCLRVYNDDEPLMSPISVARFNPIPESNEDDDGGEENDVVEEFQGFCVDIPVLPLSDKNLDVSLLQETVMVASGQGYETYAVVLKVKAPPCATVKTGARRAPIDLVTVIDVSGKMTGAKLQMMKRSMRLIISSLSSADRLSIVAFSASSKRLLPLRRMTTDGRRSARRIVDAVGSTGQEACSNDALKKAVKIMEDRMEKNSVTRILLLSDGQNERHLSNSPYHNRVSSVVTSTRFANMEIPVHVVDCGDSGAYGNSPSQDGCAKSVGGLLSVVVQDLRLQFAFLSGSDIRTRGQISAVYSLTGRPELLGSGLIKVGDLYAKEERELLVEFKIPSYSAGSHEILTVRSSYKDPSTQKLVYSKENTLSVPGQEFKASSTSGTRRLKNLYVCTRAVAESRILIERNDLSGGHRLLSSAKVLLIQSNSSSAKEFLPGLEVEMLELHRRRLLQVRYNGREAAQAVEEKSEPLTPTSAWRAAERLAKLAIIGKSMNRVSDLHGFENARF